MLRMKSPRWQRGQILSDIFHPMARNQPCYDFGDDFEVENAFSKRRISLEKKEMSG